MTKELKEKLERAEKYYAEELERKDKMIEELRDQNTVMMKASLKQSKKIEELTKKLDEAINSKKS